MNDSIALLPHIKLHLNISHPSYEEIYAFGYECADAEIGEDENPYKQGTQNHNEWLEGWWDGFYGVEPLFKIVDNSNDVQLIGDMRAANDHLYPPLEGSFLLIFLKITGALTATALLGYQLFELVA